MSTATMRLDAGWSFATTLAMGSAGANADSEDRSAMQPGGRLAVLVAEAGTR